MKQLLCQRASGSCMSHVRIFLGLSKSSISQILNKSAYFSGMQVPHLSDYWPSLPIGHVAEATRVSILQQITILVTHAEGTIVRILAQLTCLPCSGSNTSKFTSIDHNTCYTCRSHTCLTSFQAYLPVM